MNGNASILPLLYEAKGCFCYLIIKGAGHVRLLAVEINANNEESRIEGRYSLHKKLGADEYYG